MFEDEKENLVHWLVEQCHTIRYTETFTEKYKIPIEEARIVDIAKDMERKTFLDTKFTSKYEPRVRVRKLLAILKSVIERINIIPTFGTGKGAIKRGVRYLESGILIERCAGNFIVPIDWSLGIFWKPWKGKT